MSTEQQSQLLDNKPEQVQSQTLPDDGPGRASPSNSSNDSSVHRSFSTSGGNSLSSFNNTSQADLQALNESFPSTPRIDTLEHFKADLQALDDGSHTTPLLSFRVPPQKEEILASFLGQLGAARYSYDFETGYALVEMGETTMHAQCAILLTKLLQRSIDFVRDILNDDVAADDPRFAPTTADRVTARQIISRLDSLWQNDSARIFRENKFTKQPDVQFREEADDDAVDDVSKFPPILAEIAFSQHTAEVEKKAKRYIDLTNGLIRTVIILHITFPDARKATFSIWVADPSGKPVLAQEAVIYDANADVQADGQVHLFAADFLSKAYGILPEYTKRQFPVESASEDQSEERKNEHTFTGLHATIGFDELRALVDKAYRRHCKAEQHPCEGRRAALHP